MGRTLFWQLWLLFSIALSGYFGARLLGTPRVVAAHSVAPAKPKSGLLPTVRRPSPVGAVAPNPSWLTLRLAVAETGNELCELLERLEPTDDTSTTYAIASVLERTRLRSLRVCATQALSKQPTEVAESWLVDLAEDPEPEVSRPALAALAARTDSMAHTAVSDAAHSANASVRVNATLALLKARSPEPFLLAKDLIESLDDPDTVNEVVDALSESGDVRALPVFESLLARGSRELHLRSIAALGMLGQARGIALIEPFLELGSAGEFKAALGALGKLDPERALDRVLRVAREGGPERRKVALNTLAQMTSPAARQAIEGLLDTDDTYLVRFALQALASTHDPDLEERFLRLLHTGTPSLHDAAANALATLGTPGAVSHLRALALDSRSEAAEAAQRALSELPDSEDELRARRIGALSDHSLDAEAHELAANALAGDPSDAAQSALLTYFARGEHGTDTLQRVLSEARSDTVATLVEHLPGESDPAQRQAVVTALVERAEPRFADALRSAANTDDAELRELALRGLAKLGDPSTADWVRAELAAPSGENRGLALSLLTTRADPEALEQLVTLSTDPDQELAGSALAAVRERAPARAAELAARRFARATSEERRALLDSVAGLSSRLAQPLYEAGLNDASDETALRALELLTQLEGPTVAERLLSVAHDSGRSHDLRSAAAAALRSLGGPLARSNRFLLDELQPREPVTFISCGGWS